MNEEIDPVLADSYFGLIILLILSQVLVLGVIKLFGLIFNNNSSKSYSRPEIKKEKISEKVEEPPAVYEVAPKKTSKKRVSSAPRKKKSEPVSKTVIKSEPVGVKDLLRVCFMAPNDVQGIFPIAIFPVRGTVIRTHRYGVSKRRGFKEEGFQFAIEQEFGHLYEVSGEVRLNTGSETRPFEPDIALIKNSKDNPIRIDIEIDEPYAGISRRATHCKGDDVHRDAYFKDRGWVVLRFSERQVHLHLKYCLAIIATVLKRIDTSYVFPDHLPLNYSKIRENHWDLVQAQAWEVENYRENYLNHEFQTLSDVPDFVDRDLNEQEMAEEKLVEPSLIGELGTSVLEVFNKKNASNRDTRIKFYPEPHVYTVDGIPFKSVSGLISKYFPKFDSYGQAARLSPRNSLYGLPVEEIVGRWDAKGKTSAEEGTYLHAQIENYYLGKSYDRPAEFEYFEDFHKVHSHLKPYRSEWRVFDEEMQVAGTIDFVAKEGRAFDMYDWKRTRKVVDFEGDPITWDSYGKYGIGPLSSISDTSYNRYCIQQTIYRYILEKNYGLKIRKMYLVVLHPEYNRYFKVEAEYQPELLQEMLQES
jgi:hypothetical protein